jgi:hypothetical protein
MRIAAISAAAMAALCLALAPAYGAQKGKSGGPSTHASGSSTHASGSSTHASGSSTHASGSSTHGGGTHAQGAQTTHGSQHGAPPKTTTPKVHGNPHTTTTHTTTTTTLNPIAQKLQGKPLGDRIQKMLPQGMTLNTASEGFKNQGQFIAAVHVSKNLGIPFAQLKATMLGTPTTATSGTNATSTTSTSTSTNPMSLGQAIQRLKPSANSSAEAMLAEKQASDDLRTTSTTSTSKSKKKTSGK